MTRYFGARGEGKPETKADRRERAKARATRRRQAIAALSDRAKTKALGHAIAVNVIAKGSFAEGDLALAGFTPEDGKRLFTGALAIARRIDPAVDSAVTAP